MRRDETMTTEKKYLASDGTPWAGWRYVDVVCRAGEWWVQAYNVTESLPNGRIGHPGAHYGPYPTGDAALAKASTVPLREEGVIFDRGNE
jgi:hypothetical protein